MNNKNKTILKSLFILSIFALAIQVSAVWINPPSTPLPNTPPNNNTPPPVNVGIDAQMKQGNLGVVGIRAVYNPNTGAGGLGLFDSQVGIGTDSPGVPHMPTQPLDVLGNVKFSGALMPNGDTGTSGQVLTSAGTGVPTWTTISGGGNVLGGGSGTTNYVTKWTNNNTIGNSQIFDNGTNVGVGNANPGTKLDVSGTLKATGFQLGSSATSGHVLTTDSNGVGTWQASSGGGGGNGWTDDGTTVRLTTIGPNPPSDHVRIGDTTIIYKGTSTIDANRFLYAPGSPGFFNMFIGKGAGKISCNTTDCHSNVGIGEESLKSISGGWYNIGIGHLTLSATTTGYDNIAIGDLTMVNNTTGFRNVAIGGGDAGPTSNNLNNTIALGFGAKPDANNKAKIGNANINWIGGQVPWSPASDMRLKKDIKDIDLGLDFITNLRPVSYQMKSDTDGKLSYGFIAQEVEKLLGDKKTKIIETENTAEGLKYLRYNDLIAPMVKGMQELKIENDLLRIENDSLKKRVEVIESKLNI